MVNNKLKKLILASLFAALTCVLTIVVQIPMPICGYVNLGDCIVLLSAWILGPVYGAVAAGLGAGLADIISGYAIYAPATFVIKALVAVTAYFVCKALCKIITKDALSFVPRLISGIAGEAIMILGYFLYEATVMGYGLGAASGIAGNSIQAVAGIVASVALAEVLTRNKALNRLIFENNKNVKNN